MKKFSLILAAFLLGGCVSKKLANTCYKEGNYENAYNIYLEYAKKGFPKSYLKLAKMIYNQYINKPPYVQREYALKAYSNGFKEASIYIADAYFKEGNIKQAYYWYEKSDFNLMNVKDFKNYIVCIEQLEDFKTQVKKLRSLEKHALDTKNYRLLDVIGKMYLKNTHLYNPEKGEKYLLEAYNHGVVDAGTALGIYYIKSGKNPKKGYEILNSLLNKDANAAYFIGNYLYDLMVQQEQEMNSGCITSTFKNPEEFFVKKLTIYKFDRIFTLKNIVTAYKQAYKLGKKNAFYKLIRLDIEDNNFVNKNAKTYSGMSLNEIEAFLQKQNDIESKLILAKLYELYLKPHTKAKEIYKWYEKYDKIQAYWHLYQYEKRFENSVNFMYLDYLANEKFVPAIVERAYQETIENKNVQENKKTLEYYANQNNILALNYLGSLYSREVFVPKKKSFEYYTKACELEKKPFYIPSEDMKIANYYTDMLGDTDRAMSINYYYAQFDNIKAQLKVVRFYKNNNDTEKMKKWLLGLKNSSSQNALEVYYLFVLKGYVEGDFKKALKYYENLKTPQSYVVLGNVYAVGYKVDFDPQKAVEYYDKAIESGIKQAIYMKIDLYKKINIDGKYDSLILSLYNEAIRMNVPYAKVMLAKYYIEKGEKKKALKVLRSIKNYQKDEVARYLIYKLTGKIKFIANKDSNYGYMLLEKANRYAKKGHYRGALYYAFRALRCETPQSVPVTYELMSKINSVSVIKRIYNRAKKAPKCHLKVLYYNF